MKRKYALENTNILPEIYLCKLQICEFEITADSGQQFLSHAKKS